MVEFSQHNHTTSPAEIEALKVRLTIRKRAIESRDVPALIIAYIYSYIQLKVVFIVRKCVWVE